MSLVPRTVTEAGDDRSRPLAAFRDAGALVLLGDPGVGKTTEFRREVEALGADALFLPARDFLAFVETRAAEWSGKTLFIDGLDEVRAGKGDPRTPLDEIRRRLDALGRPRFRLSCRAADWLGPGDRERLRAVSPNEALTVLRLDPLRDADIVSLLEMRHPDGDARNFLKSARDKGLFGWLRNPQGLEILIKAFAAGRRWPESRREAFETACLRMASEPNAEHRHAAKDQPAPAEVLDAAAEICAAVLLSGRPDARSMSLARTTTTRPWTASGRPTGFWLAPHSIPSCSPQPTPPPGSSRRTTANWRNSWARGISRGGSKAACRLAACSP